MQNQQIADTLVHIADLLEIQGANPFRTRAYRNTARTLQDLTEPVTAILADSDRSLTEIAGIGKDLAAKIETLVKTGTLPQLDELQAEIPQGVLDLLRVPNLGPKKVSVLYHQLHITSLGELRAACEAEQVRGLKGFGPKTEATILSGIELAERAGKRLYWRDADQIVHRLLSHMSLLDGIRQMAPAGSYRRGRETVGDLDLLVDATDSDAVMDHFGQFEGVVETVARGSTKMSVRLENGLQIDLRVVPSESYGAALQYFTGSKQHNVVLRGLAKDLDLKVNEWGVFRTDGKDEVYVAGVSEAEVYAALDLPCFPPELREARQEFDWAACGELPTLIELTDLRGDLHMHTRATDGKATLAEMAEAALARGLSYIAITDHSQRVSMARGLNPARLRRQWAEINRLNARFEERAFVVLKGIECDILEQGGLDLPDDVLAEADWVVASVHYGQNQSQQQITSRILEAVEHPYVSAIAHPTGRLINRRDPYQVDLNQVFRAAAEHRKLLELNAHPARLDLNDVNCAAAKRYGIPIVINTDAHSTAGLDVLRYGVLQARRGGLTPADVANTRPWVEMSELIGRS